MVLPALPETPLINTWFSQVDNALTIRAVSDGFLITLRNISR